jgi:hypothetical protein
VQVHDEKSWLELKLGYEKVGPEGQSIVDFAERWAEDIEWKQDHSFREAMDLTVSGCDLELISASMFAEVLVILSQAWTYGETFIENLTYIEKRLFESAIAEKLLALEERAKQ